MFGKICRICIGITWYLNSFPEGGRSARDEFGISEYRCQLTLQAEGYLHEAQTASYSSENIADINPHRKEIFK